VHLIPLGNGVFTKVDDEDFDFLACFTWSLADGYARTIIDGHTVKMARLIMDAGPGDIVDHRDRDTLNNQRFNLRFATKSQNMINSGLWAHNSSGYKGVVWDKARNKWRAQIKVNQRMINLGRFTNIAEAVTARDQAVVKYFGDFGVTNKDLGLYVP
jgi:hypothetical protein